MKTESGDAATTPAPTPAAAQQPAAVATSTTTTTTAVASSATPPVTVTGTGTSTPTPTYTTTQWSNAQIPIDPALQQQSATAYQHYQNYASHYPTAAYPTHYQAYAPPITPQRAATATSSSTTTTGTAGNPTSSTGGANANVEATDIATLNDALGSAGVDLRAEEESLQRAHGDQHQPFRVYDDRSKKQPPMPNFDTRFLGQTMRTLSSSHKVTRIPDDSINYLALALRARLQDLVTAMVMAAKHRTSTQFDRPASHFSDGQPMWSIVVRSDVAKQLAAIERAEREEETRIRRERKERADLAAAHAAALAAQANAAGGVPGVGGMGIGGMGIGASAAIGGEDEYEGGTKKKRKKEGPGVTARNMSEDVRKKMSNAVATQAAGLGGRYAWMNAANSNSPIPPKPKPVATGASTMTTTTTTSTTTTTGATGTGTGTAGSTTTTTTTTSTMTTGTSATLTSSWATPYIPTKPKQSQPSQEETDTRLAITMRDAMFVVEKERGHGAGRGSARGWV